MYLDYCSWYSSDLGCRAKQASLKLWAQGVVLSAAALVQGMGQCCMLACARGLHSSDRSGQVAWSAFVVHSCSLVWLKRFRGSGSSGSVVLLQILRIRILCSTTTVDHFSVAACLWVDRRCMHAYLIILSNIPTRGAPLMGRISEGTVSSLFNGHRVLPADL